MHAEPHRAQHVLAVGPRNRRRVGGADARLRHVERKNQRGLEVLDLACEQLGAVLESILRVGCNGDASMLSTVSETEARQIEKARAISLK